MDDTGAALDEDIQVRIVQPQAFAAFDHAPFGNTRQLVGNRRREFGELRQQFHYRAQQPAIFQHRLQAAEADEVAKGFLGEDADRDRGFGHHARVADTGAGQHRHFTNHVAGLQHRYRFALAIGHAYDFAVAGQ